MNRKRVLFYPCAGRDIKTPFAAFSAIIDEFWFVDVNYHLHPLPQLRDASKLHPLPQLRDASKLDVETEKWILNGSDCQVTTQRFKNPKFNKTVCVNFAAGDGKSVFDILFADTECRRELSIFFHRGDSGGEGGSGVCWLDNRDCDGNQTGLLQHVLAKMAPSAFLCTDGSNAIDELKTHNDDRVPVPPDTHLTLASITVHGNTLTPIGTLNDRFGPTIVYKVTRP